LSAAVDFAARSASLSRVAFGVLLVLVAASGCSKLADLDGLSKNFGKVDAATGLPDGGQDQRSDRADGRDVSSASDLADGSSTGSGDGMGDGMGMDDVQDAGGDADSIGEIDGGDPSADAIRGDADQICQSQAINDATLELVSAPAATTSCGYSAADLPRYYAAVDPATFGSALACGACIRISASNVDLEAVVVNLGSSRLVVDRPRLGVSRTALSMLLPDGSTFVSEGIPWTYTSCSFATDGMIFTLQQGSSTTYAALLVQNHRYRIQSVEYRSGSIFKPLVRTTYNSWVAQAGMGAGPFTIRLTDVNGAVVEQSGVPLAIEMPFHGQAQFPVCPTP
jgi:hypothetical protein